MIERITKNEERLDKITQSIKELEDSIKKFKSIRKDLNLLNKYYGSNNWFKDKEAYENNEIEHIKGGVLSEDAVWNLNEEIDELIKEMSNIINDYKRKVIK